MPFGLPTLAQGRELLNCRLCRRITMLICLSILVVEAAFLLPSYQNRRAELMERQEVQVLLTLTTALSWHEEHSPAEMLTKIPAVFEYVLLQGLAIYDEEGRILTSRGRVPQLTPSMVTNLPARPANSHSSRDLPAGREAVRRALSDGSGYEIAWMPEATNLPFILVARLDTSGVSNELTAYVLRISGIIFILSLIVSAVAVAVLGRNVLTPILHIHRNLTAAHSDPVNAEKYKLDIKADNEIGETVIALNALLDRLSAIRRSHVKEREVRFQDFASSSSDWFWEMDEKLRFSFFSDRFAEVTGVPESVLLGKTREETGIPGVDQEVWEKHLSDLRARRPFRNFVHPRNQPDGKTVWLSINGIPWFDSAGKFRGYRGTGRDITEQVQTQRALQTAKEEAEAANRTKSEFLANISHELRTPLNAIIGFSEIMLAGAQEKDRISLHLEYLEDIHSSGLHLLSLINDILDLSKIEAGADELEEEALDCTEIANAVLRVVRQRADKSGISIDWQDNGSLPPLLADERKVKQALLNLLTNAIKFTPDGGRVRLCIHCNLDEGYVFEVSDTGIGMAPEDIPTALRQFGQVDSALNRKYEGTGLGLPLTKALVELHGGTLALQSEPDKGTTVTIRLPATRILPAEPLQQAGAGA